MKIVAYILITLGIFFFAMSFLFRLMHWTGVFQGLILGIACLLLGFVFKRKNQTTSFNKRCVR